MKGKKKVGRRGQRWFRKWQGTRLRALRKKKLLSQELLGNRAGLSGKFIGEVERGEKSISTDSLVLLCSRLEVTLFEFYLGAEPDLAKQATVTAQALYAFAVGLNEPQQKTLLGMARSAFPETRRRRARMKTQLVGSLAA